MTKDEMKDKISFALKDSILQQGFEIICKENAELKEQIEKMKCCENCRYYSRTYGHCYSYDSYQNCKSLSNWRLEEWQTKKKQENGYKSELCLKKKQQTFAVPLVKLRHTYSRYKELFLIENLIIKNNLKNLLWNFSQW